MTWREFYHWLTTTRYTRRLEAEIEILKGDNERLRGDNDALLKALYPAIKSVRNESQAKPEGPKLLKTFKW